VRGHPTRAYSNLCQRRRFVQINSHDAIVVAEQNVNLHDSVHVGDVVQNFNAANRCLKCGTANVPVFTCSNVGCQNQWCSYCGTDSPGICLIDQEVNRVNDRISSLERRITADEHTLANLITRPDADAEFKENQTLQREAERQQLKSDLEHRRDSRLNELYGDNKLRRLRSIFSGWDIFWTIAILYMGSAAMSFLMGNPSPFVEDDDLTGPDYVGATLMYSTILAWNLYRKLKPINEEISELKKSDIDVAVERVLAENTEREDEQHRREQQKRTQAKSNREARIRDAKVEIEVLRKQLADLNS
jgi:hypothetical protein